MAKEEEVGKGLTVKAMTIIEVEETRAVMKKSKEERNEIRAICIVIFYIYLFCIIVSCSLLGVAVVRRSENLFLSIACSWRQIRR